MMAILAKTNPDLAAQINFYGAISRHHFHFWQPITSAFLHAGFMHIFGNMLFLLAFGPSVEDRLGRIGFILFFLAGACVSGFAHIALSDAPAIGASGAIAAVAGAFLILFPNTKIKCFVIFFIIGVFMIPSWWLIGLFIVLDLGAQLFTPANGIANMAHLGGYAFGMVIAFTLLITGILPKEPYDMFSILKHKKRRADFKAAQQHFSNSAVHVNPHRQHKIDPVAQKIAQERAKVGSLVSQGEIAQAADQYLAMLNEFPDLASKEHSKSLTMHRDAQYQIANHLYKAGNRQAAADAFTRLLEAYPTDPERNIISVLLARIRANDLADPVGAIQLLEELSEKSLDSESKALVDNELTAIRAITQ